jgi:hypothetical protein
VNINIKLQNGLEVQGRTEEWLVAILRVLTPQQRDQVFASVAGKVIAYQTPGSYILHAEPGSLSALNK